MSKVTLNTVKYYDPADIYSYEVDNRPLYDISSNVELVNTALSHIGCYHEVYANPETEPAGGFSPLTCVLYGQNGSLFPIDIAQPITTIDYAKYPIYLVIEKLASSQYKCISFSAAFSLPGLFNKFLPDSIGRAVKVGPGGSLVDEIYFDLYYSDYAYQNIVVGKVLTPTIISFGGNQVSVLGDNRFLAKNRDDNTTGLITRIVQNDINSTAFKSVLVNSSLSAYPFSEFINQTSVPVGSQPGKTPVYFTSLPLSTNNGVFNTDNLASVLNEVHFASPSISADSHTDPKYRTTGINVASLLEFAESFLIHAKPLSSNLQEVNQQLSTSLHFDTTDNVGLTTLFDTRLVTFSTTVSGLTTSLLSNAATASGSEFGAFKSEANGGFLFHVTNNIASDVTLTDETNTFPISSLRNGTALVLYNQGNVTGSAALVLGANGPVVLESPVGIVCANPGSYDHSLTNRAYVNTMVNAAANTAKTRIPLSGSTADEPITGSLYYDLKGSDNPSTVLEWDTLVTAEIKSANPVELKTLATSDYQVFRAETPATGDAKDLTNRSFVQAKIDAALTNAIGTNFVSRTAADTIEASKTFDSTSQIITNALNPVVFHVADPDSAVELSTDSKIVQFVPLAGTVKIETSATTDLDSDTTLVTKKYMLDKIEDIAAGKVGEMIYGIWHTANKQTTTNVNEYKDWAYGTRGITPDQASLNFNTYFTVVEDGALMYTGNDEAVFTVNISDARVTGVGPSFPGAIFRTQSVIAVKSGSTVTTIARNVHQDDTDGGSIWSLVGSSCSAIVALKKNDVLYMLSEIPEVVSASLARIR